MRRRLPYALAVAAVAAGGAIAWWQLGGSDEAPPAPAAAAWQFEDGRWVRLSPSDVTRLERERASRRPGAVVVRGSIRGPEGAIADADVIFSGERGEARATTGDDGHYELELAPGFYRVYARADGYVAVGAVGEPRVPSEPEAPAADVPAGDNAPTLGLFRDLGGVDLEMRRSVVIAGVVGGPDGEPVAGAVVRATPYSPTAPRPIVGSDVDVTDSAGRFRLIVAAVPHRLEASHADFAGLANGADRHVNAAAGSEVRPELTMVPGCVITGRVVDRRGDAAGPGQIEIDVGRPPPNEFAPIGRLGPDGGFRVTRTEPGPVRLRAWPWGSPPSEIAELDCADGVRHRDVELVLSDREPQLVGTLVDAAGVPVPGAFVDLLPLFAGGMAQQEKTDDRGRFAFYALPRGRYQLSAFVDDRGAAVAPVAIPGRDVVVALSGTGTLTGQTEGLDEGSFTLVVERCLIDGGGPIEAVTMAPRSFLVPVDGGEFQLGGLPACPIEGRAVTSYRTVRFRTEISPDRAAAVGLDLRQPHKKRLDGRVLDRAGRPVPGAAVIRIDRSGTGRTATDYALSDPDGRFELTVWSGDEVRITAQDGREAALAIDWDDDRREHMTADLR